ncbi:MAG: glutathione S-transferase family protein [Gammaproteobacteria bacterium]
MIRIYGFPYTRSTRVTWALEEAGVDYEFIAVDLSKGEHKKPEFLEVNPGGKVPALVDGDFVLTESAAICTYLGEKFPSSGLVPSALTERAHYFQWCFFAMTELEAPLWTMEKHARILPASHRVPAIEKTCRWEFQRAASVLAQHMEGREYVVGNQLTAADILLGSTLNWGRKVGEVLEPGALEAYAERMAARPALARAREREAKRAG